MKFLAMHITNQKISFDILTVGNLQNIQMKFLAMHITNQKISFDILTVGNLKNIFMEHDLYLMS